MDSGYMQNDVHFLELADTSYIDDILLDRAGNMKVIPYADLKDIPQEHRIEKKTLFLSGRSEF